MDHISKLLTKKEKGDLKIIAKIMSTTPANVGVLLRRHGAKRHKMAVDLLEKVIQNREQLIEQSNQDQ